MFTDNELNFCVFLFSEPDLPTHGMVCVCSPACTNYKSLDLLLMIYDLLDILLDHWRQLLISNGSFQTTAIACFFGSFFLGNCGFSDNCCCPLNLSWAVLFLPTSVACCLHNLVSTAAAYILGLGCRPQTAQGIPLPVVMRHFPSVWWLPSQDRMPSPNVVVSPADCPWCPAMLEAHWGESGDDPQRYWSARVPCSVFFLTLYL